MTTNSMKILLAAVNAKYIHSNLAVYCLKSYAAAKGYEVEIAEYTINQQPGEVLTDLYQRNADVVAFSCYIWNIGFIQTLICDYKKLRPESELWLGGPEVSYRGEQLLKEFGQLRGILVGEGEETFARIVGAYQNGCVQNGCGQNEIADAAGKEAFAKKKDKKALPAIVDFSGIPGIVVRLPEGKIITTPPAVPLDFSALPFPYGNGAVTVENNTENGAVLWNTSLASFENRIVYYESSRGCPFSCAYCLSSIDKRVRFRKMDLVKKELSFFLEQGVPQVKFIDRTFNVNAQRTMELWSFIKENDNGKTNFHFEIAAELLTAEQIELLNSLRPGLIQLEIGVQSTNAETLSAVNRKTELRKLQKTVAAVRDKNNVHIHLDLIAGLPYETLDSFRHSFDEVYRMRPHQLQLGFLKVLFGAPMEQMAKENGTVCQSAPPYEVLATKWLSYDDIILLKKVEELVEAYYNSGQFVYSFLYLQHFTESPFVLLEALAAYYGEQGYFGVKLSRRKRYEILQEFVERYFLHKAVQDALEDGEASYAEHRKKLCAEHRETPDYLVFEQLLFYDYCLREKPKARPAFGESSQLDKQTLKKVYASFGIKREAEGMHDVEQFVLDPVQTAENGRTMGTACYVLFSYEQREAMYGGARTKTVLQVKEQS